MVVIHKYAVVHALELKWIVYSTGWNVVCLNIISLKRGIPIPVTSRFDPRSLVRQTDTRFETNES